MSTSETRSHERPASVPWPPILLVATVLGALALGAVVPLPWPGIGDGPAQVIGLGLGGLGVLLIGWAAATLARHRTTILPHKGADRLVTDGPYARLRNPIYVGDVLLLMGAAEITRNIWFVLLAIPFIGLITWLAILPEERHLRARFGEAFDDYVARTRRWI